MPQTDGLAVKVTNLRRTFGSFVAVNNISFEVKKGAIYGFLGPNGAGKSTTIRILCGILAPSGGTGMVGGYDIRKDAEKIKSCIGYMSQKFSLYEDLTVEENINFFSGIYCVPEAKKEARKRFVIEMAGLNGELNTRTSVLSGGWKQRLALGCAILHEPPILFLDEPTSGVDPINRRRFWSLIYDLANKGVTIFVTTHYMDEAEYFDEIAFIYKGALVAQGSPHELKTHVVKDKILDLHCSDPQKALEVLCTLPCILEASLFGQGLHAEVKETENAKQQIRETLMNNHIQLYRCEEIEATLEDVFIALIESYDSVKNRV